jgi:protein-tyrosine-phosphatase
LVRRVEPGIEVNPIVVAAMTERGIDIGGEFPKPWTDETVRAADVVITMGCGDACPIFPGKRYEDWPVDDQPGQDLVTVRGIRDDLESHRPALKPSQHLPTLGGDPIRAAPAVRMVGAHRCHRA